MTLKVKVCGVKSITHVKACIKGKAKMFGKMPFPRHYHLILFPNISANLIATGFIDNDLSTLPSGLPKCEAIINFPPLSIKYLIVLINVSCYIVVRKLQRVT